MSRIKSRRSGVYGLDFNNALHFSSRTAIPAHASGVRGHRGARRKSAHEVLVACATASLSIFFYYLLKINDHINLLVCRVVDCRGGINVVQFQNIDDPEFRNARLIADFSKNIQTDHAWILRSCCLLALTLVVVALSRRYSRTLSSILTFRERGPFQGDDPALARAAQFMRDSEDGQYLSRYNTKSLKC